MSDDRQDVYSVYIDYQNTNPDIDTITESAAMQRNAGQNFTMNKRMLKDVLDRGKFTVPEYQRLFAWEEEQHRELWADIEKFIGGDLENDSEEISDIFFSTIYLAVDEDKIVYEIIDGQQRLTTIHILLRVILEHLEEVSEGGELSELEVEKLCNQGISQIEAILYDPSADKIGKEPRLSLNKHDEEVFNAIIRGPEAQVEYFSFERENVKGWGNIPTRIRDVIDKLEIDEDVIEKINSNRENFSRFVPIYKSNERLIDTYVFYRHRIGEMLANCETPEEKALALINLKNYIRRSYYVGEFIIREADPGFRMRIFEILNDRGVELDKIDKMRATVVNTFFNEDDEVKDDYIQKWEDIVVEFGTNSDDIDDYLSVYLSIVDENIEEVGDASAELMNAFSTRNIETDVKPRFDNPKTAKPFLSEARSYLDYYTDMTETSEEGKVEIRHTDLGTVEEDVEEILTRLNKLKTEQWHTLVLELYRHSDKNGREDEFYKTLETVEKLNLRRLLAGVDARSLEGVFVQATHRFRGMGEEEPVGYEGVRQYLIDEIKAEGPDMFGDRFLDTISQQQSWSPGDAKLVLWRIASERFKEEGYAVDRELNMGNVHLEHVFPQTFVSDPSNPVWLTEFFELEESKVDIVDEIREYINLKNQPDEELDENEIRRRNSIEDFITNGFVEDIGNYLLLSDGDNIRASNLPFGEKIVDYYNNEDDFKIIYPNRYFTNENSRMDDERHSRLLEEIEELEDEDTEREDISQETIEYFNSFWNYEEMKQRRVEMLLDILEYLGLEVIEDEFGLESDWNEVQRRIEEKTEEEFEKRLSLRSL